MNRQAQSFTIDFAFAVLIMTAALLTLVTVHPWSRTERDENPGRVEVLLSQGVPSDWNETTVVVAGILTGSELNQTKIDLFASFTDDERSRFLGLTRPAAFRINYNNSVLCASCGAVPMDADQLIVIRRFAILNGSLARVEVSLYS